MGKELVARAIHRTGKRAKSAFIKMNCAALPANLAESELFGHEAGAFTGADRLRKGRFELTDGETIFLDEISELPLDLQSKRHRQLQNTLRKAVHAELAEMTAAGLDKMITGEGEKTLHVFLQVHLPRTFSPNQVKRLQDKMAESVGRPVELLVRTILTRDVSAGGHTNTPVAQYLDGNFIAESECPTLNKIAITD